MPGLLIVNFGGPRDLGEVDQFLRSLLLDEDVIWTGLPKVLHRWLFQRIASKRARTLVHDYAKIGGKSPIYEDTEYVARALGHRLKRTVWTFHRYLPKTHPASLASIEASDEEEIIVFPMFPQFSYATTGSIARWFREQLTTKSAAKLRWIKSYGTDQRFIECHKRILAQFLALHQLSHENTLLLFSMHGLPRCFVCLGDPYRQECYDSYDAIAAHFPRYQTALSFQSKFGKGIWLEPSTEESCHKIVAQKFSQREIANVVVIPLSFTSDHIETLFEIEEQYLSILRQAGYGAYRCPSLNRETHWLEAIAAIIEEEAPRCDNDSLIRPFKRRALCKKSCLCSSAVESR
jgi:ferrochelatase